MDLRQQILNTILSIPALLIALTVHEYAHGYAAYKMGDPTAKYSGRLSLNPSHHLDFVGTLCLLFFHFGWARPVPINPRNFRDPKKGSVIVSLAGPLSNFIVALISMFVFAIMLRVFPYPYEGIYEFFLYIMDAMVQLNVGLMVFNLLPIPPLDGSKVLLEFLPYRLKYKFYQFERYSGLILIVLVATNVLTPILITLRSWVYMLINLIVGLVL